MSPKFQNAEWGGGSDLFLDSSKRKLLFGDAPLPCQGLCIIRPTNITGRFQPSRSWSRVVLLQEAVVAVCVTREGPGRAWSPAPIHISTTAGTAQSWGLMDCRKAWLHLLENYAAVLWKAAAAFCCMAAAPCLCPVLGRGQEAGQPLPSAGWGVGNNCNVMHYDILHLNIFNAKKSLFRFNRTIVKEVDWFNQISLRRHIKQSSILTNQNCPNLLVS